MAYQKSANVNSSPNIEKGRIIEDMKKIKAYRDQIQQVYDKMNNSTFVNVTAFESLKLISKALTNLDYALGNFKM